MTESDQIKQKIDLILSKSEAVNRLLVKILGLLFDMTREINDLQFDIPIMAPKLQSAISDLNSMDATLDDFREQLQRLYDAL
jgi:hypothetical protein